MHKKIQDDPTSLLENTYQHVAFQKKQNYNPNVLPHHLPRLVHNLEALLSALFHHIKPLYFKNPKNKIVKCENCNFRTMLSTK